MIVALFGLSEIVISGSKRSGTNSAATDRGSYWVFRIGIPFALALAFVLAIRVPQAHLDGGLAVDALAVGLFIVGTALRWASIIHLGRFFTVDVAIAPDHRVIDTGPYRYLRHPSYTGGLTAFLGLGFALHNWLSLLALMLPVLAIHLYRMGVEEQALAQGLGEPYRAYARRTRRLIPGVY